MAKELPYFKFEPSEWQNGDIQMCSPEARIVFIDICCSYWQRLGSLPYAFALQRHCGGIENVMRELENANAIKIENDFLTINFLDEQIEELSKKSEKARQSADARWKKKKNANASKTQSVRNANRIEENRIEENREEEKTKFLRSITDVNELDDQVDKITFSFWELFKRNLEEAGITKTTNLDKATLEKWRIPIRLAIESDKRTREEFEEIWKFLGKNEFWKKNIQSTVKLREQFERLLVEARTKPQAKEDKNKMSPEYMARLAEKLRS
jgi:hypothetical protein